MGHMPFPAVPVRNKIMDYDQTDIPRGYDRARDRGPEHIALWMNEIESLLDGRRIDGIVDLGCGSGRFSEGLAARFDTAVTGVDPSGKMLEQAQAKREDDRQSDEEFRSGLDALRAHSEKTESDAVVEPIDLFVFQK